MMISGKAKVAGVIGWPVSHSRSPRLHGYWLEQHGIDGAYVPLAVPPDRVAEALAGVLALGLRGINVTVPHKEAVYSLLDRLEDSARRVGAVNTVVVDENRQLVGANTDGIGFLANLADGAPEWRAGSGPVVVLGAGGAARAVVAALIDAGVPELRLINRTRERAEALARLVGGPIRVESWSDRHDAMAEATLLVNTTTIGMGGSAVEPDPATRFDLEHLPCSAVVTDIVYTPLVTPLLEAAARAGCRTVDGLGMLLHQARPGFRAWFGVDPEVTPGLRAHVLACPARGQSPV
jgi:shikimate dehydrogenase